MQFNKSKTLYFLGIGGIGMSALARYFVKSGFRVAGYDRNRTPLTLLLEKEGIEIHYTDNPALIPADTGSVIYTPAVPQSNAEYQFLTSLSIPILKRAQVLGMLSAEYKTIACAGTHGKTTTSTLTAHLLKSSNTDCNAFLGGISNNYQSNVLFSDTSPLMVVEADEFDRSFLQLTPAIAIITSMDADHLDIYGSRDNIIEAFNLFVSNIVPGGNLVINKGLQENILGHHPINQYSYSMNEKADFWISGLNLQNGLYHFDLHHPNGSLVDLQLGIPGLYNVENAVASSAAAILCGISDDELRNGLQSFSGVQRRFQVRINSEATVYIDDYAHHPEEIKACITSARAMFANRKITVIFQPHLYSRTRDFASEFSESLALADEVVLLPIYPAREKPIEGVESSLLAAGIKDREVHLLTKKEIPGFFGNHKTDIVITMGAGDIDELAPEVEQYINTKLKNL